MKGLDDFHLLGILVATQFGKKPMNVGTLVRRLGLSQSLVSQRLRRLQKEGLLERVTVPTPSGRIVHYRPVPSVSIQWVSPSERVALQWTARDEVDWRFPLISQVPDAPARKTLLALLSRLEAEPWVVPRPAVGKRQPDSAGLTVVAYGSCARGTARAGSDLDILTIQQDRGREALVKERVEAICADVSLTTPRPIQVMHLQADELAALGRSVKASIQGEGLVVFHAAPSRSHARSSRTWEFVYGAR